MRERACAVSQGEDFKKHSLQQECLRHHASTTAAGASARNAGDRAYASKTASGASARSVWGRASAPTSARRARARNAGDRRHASITALRARARNVAAVPRTRAAWMQAGVLQLAKMPNNGAGSRESRQGEGGNAPMSESESADSSSDASSFSDDERSGSDHKGLDGSSGDFDRDEEKAFNCRLDALIRTCEDVILLYAQPSPALSGENVTHLTTPFTVSRGGRRSSLTAVTGEASTNRCRVEL